MCVNIKMNPGSKILQTWVRSCLIDIRSIVKHRNDTLICLCAMQSRVPNPHNSIMDVAQGAIVLTYILILSSSKKQIQNRRHTTELSLTL